MAIDPIEYISPGVELRPRQFVVFTTDSRTDVILAADGKPASDSWQVPVFESQPDAEQIAGAMPQACAEIYDYQGRANAPLKRSYHESVRKRFDPLRRARRDCWVGGGFLAAFSVWAIAARNDNWRFFWFYLLGMKLFVIGAVLLVRGVVYFAGHWVKPPRPPL